MEDYKIGYSFDKRTGEFISEEIVYLEKATNTYPCADNVTFIEPPVVTEHQKQVWTGNDWSILSDYRGEKYYNTKGEELGIVSELGVDVIVKIPPEIDRQFYELEWNGLDWSIALKKDCIIGKDGNPREMNQVEKIQAGLEEMPDGMKIVDNMLTFKTRDDLFAEGKMTVEQYNADVDAERESRFKSETDKMGLMYLRGECTLDEWKSAMDKIREELPKK